jgi:uncharacterized protein (DUF697 family)/predicted GTPase
VAETPKHDAGNEVQRPHRGEPDRFRSEEVLEREPTEQFATERAQAYAEMPPVSILVTGQTGVGKSTLVNAVLRAPLARTGTGKPVTEHIKAWTMEGIPLTLYDTPGIELGREGGRVGAEFRDLIAQKRKLPVEQQIHLVWYCVAAESRRIQDYEVALLKQLTAELPTVLVMTQCLGPQDDSVLRFSRELQSVIVREGLDIDQRRPVLTLAAPRTIGPHTIEPFGLEELVQRSYQRLPEVVAAAFVNAQAVDLDLKKSSARKTVLWASGIAASIGAVPIPIPDAAPLLALQASMLARITVQMGVDFDDATRNFLIRSVIGSGALAMIGKQAASMLLKAVPGLGSAINAGVAAALTAALGEAFIQLCAEVLRRQAAGGAMPRTEMADYLMDAFKHSYARSR